MGEYELRQAADALQELAVPGYCDVDIEKITISTFNDVVKVLISTTYPQWTRAFNEHKPDGMCRCWSSGDTTWVSFVREDRESIQIEYTAKLKVNHEKLSGVMQGETLSELTSKGFLVDEGELTRQHGRREFEKLRSSGYRRR